MESNDFEILSKMISNMKHILGLNEIKPKNKKYVSYRNWAGYGYKEPIHEKMVEQGYAKVVYKQMFSEYIYSLTPAGIKYLEEILGIKIIFQH